MVASAHEIQNAGTAASYYQGEDGLSEGDAAFTAWWGKGAADLELSGEVEGARFTQLLLGFVGDRRLGSVREGELRHKPGWDITFSAPKSVSIMAQVAGDARLFGAHRQAVATALGHAERYLATARIRNGGEQTTQTTGSLVVATFEHLTSRAHDPQLHTHAVVINATKGNDNIWRSLHDHALFRCLSGLGAVYRLELANAVSELGYATERTRHGFEIGGVPSEALKAMSQRRAAITAYLAAKGDPGKATSAQRRIAVLATRDAKHVVGLDHLTAQWQDSAAAAGFGRPDQLRLIAEAGSRVRERSPDDCFDLLAWEAVGFAAAKLSERDAVFAERRLVEEAGAYAFGRLDQRAIHLAVVEARVHGSLIDRTYRTPHGSDFPGFTTPENIRTEHEMLRLETLGRGAAAPLAGPVEAGRVVERAARQSAIAGFSWTSDQRRAAIALLTSNNHVIAVQGHAGTAKTTTVLAAYTREAEARGFAVVALAPTAIAAQVLGDALDRKGDTVARHLLTNSPVRSGKREVWLTDEASLLSAQDMVALLEKADKSEARVVLVGDVNQLGSVGAGAAFVQLQRGGMATARLAEIVRQTNADTRDAVLAAIEGHAGKVLAALDRGGGTVIEQATREQRLASIADRFVALTPAERKRALVIEPSRTGRDILSGLIRDRLVRRGELSGAALTFQALENKNLTRAEIRQGIGFERGDVVRFARDYPLRGVRRGEPLTISVIGPDRGWIGLTGQDGSLVRWHPGYWGKQAQFFQPKGLELRVGDAVQFTRNDRGRGRINGRGGQVTAIDTAAGTATLRLENGQVQRLNTADLRDAHLRHAWVHTAYAAQGRTADRVLVHAESEAVNLVDQKFLYVAVSRARMEAVIVTDDREKLVAAVYERAGEKQTAIDADGPSSGKSLEPSASL
jgi:conjugative relaxase-like TrwC/TraI family protein